MSFILIISVFVFIPFATLTAQEVAFQAPQEELAKNNLESFARTYRDISVIHTDYERRILVSSDQTEADALQREAIQKMNQAVTDHGLSIQEYNTIHGTIQNDPALKEEFMTVLHRTPQTD
jgi:GTP1/Obg family GTP-binding protein